MPETQTRHPRRTAGPRRCLRGVNALRPQHHGLLWNCVDLRGAASNQTPMVCGAGAARPGGDGRGRGGAVRPRAMGLRTVAENGPCPATPAPRMGGRPGRQGWLSEASARRVGACAARQCGTGIPARGLDLFGPAASPANHQPATGTNGCLVSALLFVARKSRRARRSRPTLSEDHRQGCRWHVALRGWAFPGARTFSPQQVRGAWRGPCACPAACGLGSPRSRR